MFEEQEKQEETEGSMASLGVDTFLSVGVGTSTTSQAAVEALVGNVDLLAAGAAGEHQLGQGQGQAEKLGQGLGGTLLQLVPESKGSQSDQKASGNTEISNVPDEAGLVVSAGGADSQVGSELVNVVAANLLGDQPVNQTVPMGVEEDSDNPCENIQSLI